MQRHGVVCLENISFYNHVTIAVGQGGHTSFDSSGVKRKF